MESGLRFHIDERPSFADIVHSLSLESTEVEDAGFVKAVATNKAGKATTEAKLLIEGEHFIIQSSYVLCMYQLKIDSSVIIIPSTEIESGMFLFSLIEVHANLIVP